MENEIDLLQLVRKIWEKKWIITAFTALCVIITGVISLFVLKPLYEANVKVLIEKEEARYFIEDRYTNSDVSLYMQVIKTYEEIAKSREVRQKVEDYLQDEDYDKTKDINITSAADTLIITISLTNPSLERVADYANAYAEQFIQVAGEVLPACDLTILDKAVKPSAPISPNIMKNLFLSLFLGMCLSMGIVIIMEVFSQHIQTEQDVETYLNYPILGVFPKDKLITGDRHVV